MSFLKQAQGYGLSELTLRSTLFAICCVCAVSSSAWAQRSGGSTLKSMPPVTITVQAASFEYRPDLGGVYDRTRGIVWGYSLTGYSNSSSTHKFAMSLGSAYASQLKKAGDDKEAYYYYLLVTYGIDDPSLLEAAEKLWSAADVAALSNNWRIPTLSESRDAVSRGLFTYGVGGLNMWTGSPADVNFGLPYDGILTWTSNTEKSKGSTSAWAFSPRDGGALLIGIGSTADAIVVRSYTGP
ncbi:hypothetical protein SH449x_004761 [Pirellulaceae bacterium SH449]